MPLNEGSDFLLMQSFNAHEISRVRLTGYKEGYAFVLANSNQLSKWHFPPRPDLLHQGDQNPGKGREESYIVILNAKRNKSSHIYPE
jgi:hypothetical protein